MSKIAFVFPGQGSQYVGMGKDLVAKFSYTKKFFDEANSALGFDLAKLCFEGPDEELKKTEIHPAGDTDGLGDLPRGDEVFRRHQGGSGGGAQPG